MRAKQWFAEGTRGYAIGLVAIVVAVAVRLTLDPSFGTKSPFLLFSAAVLTASWFGGWRPGLATTLLAALVKEASAGWTHFVSGAPPDAFVKVVSSAGFQLHLSKPVQPSELVTVVASLAARRN